MSNPNPSDNEPVVILLVEDNPDHAELVMRNFENHPVTNRVIHLTDGQQALDYLHRRGAFTDPETSPRPHLVLLDLRLPKVDGLEVLQEVKHDESLQDIPVVILTTSKSDPDVTEAYKHHTNTYLIKPSDFGQFSRLIHELGFCCQDQGFYWVGREHQPGNASLEQSR